MFRKRRSFKRRAYGARSYRRTNRTPFRRNRRTAFRKNYRRRPAINQRAITQRNISLDYDLILDAPPLAVNDPGYYQCYLQFNPCSNEPTLLGVPEIIMLNQLPNLVTVMSTIPDSELLSLRALYGTTKLTKIIVKFRPASTVYNILPNGQLATMDVIPIYGNLDDFVSATGTMTGDPQVSAVASHMKQKPYCRTVSIMKPWTRVLSPNQFISWNGFITGTSMFTNKNAYVDITNNNTRLNGLYIGMSPMTSNTPAGGTFYTPTSTAGGSSRLFVGRLTFIYYQRFKTRN